MPTKTMWQTWHTWQTWQTRKKQAFFVGQAFRHPKSPSKEHVDPERLTVNQLDANRLQHAPAETHFS
jgi:hypothetical protein